MRKAHEIIDNFRSPLTLIGAVLFVVLFFVHWYFVGIYAVNAPLADEWPVMFSVDRPIKPFTWPWVFEFNNEHRTVPTKLQVWLNYILFDVNLAYQVIFNFALYGITVLGAIKIYRFAGMSPLFILAFFTFALCDADKNNFHWAIQSQWHFFFLAFTWGTYFLFRKEEATAKDMLLCSALFIVSAWSFASGLVLVIIGLASYLFHNLYRQIRSKPFATWPKVFVFLLLPFIVSTVFWFWGYVSPAEHPNYVYPWQSRFWSFLSAELSWMYGVEARSDFWSTIAMISAFGGFGYLGLDYLKNPSKKTAMLLAFSLAFLACLCSISMGRGGLGTALAKESRYYALVILLLPTIAWGIKRIPKIGFSACVLTFVLCLYGHMDNWNYKKTYRDIAVRMINGINCIEEDPHLRSCEYPIFGGSLYLTWPWAKERGLSFANQDFPLPLPD